MKFQLSNGLTVVGLEQHAAKVAAFQVWVKVGSAFVAPVISSRKVSSPS